MMQHCFQVRSEEHYDIYLKRDDEGFQPNQNVLRGIERYQYIFSLTAMFAQSEKFVEMFIKHNAEELLHNLPRRKPRVANFSKPQAVSLLNCIHTDVCEVSHDVTQELFDSLAIPELTTHIEWNYIEIKRNSI